jgi:hypothetical protein
MGHTSNLLSDTINKVEQERDSDKLEVELYPGAVNLRYLHVREKKTLTPKRIMWVRYNSTVEFNDGSICHIKYLNAEYTRMNGGRI